MRFPGSSIPPCLGKPPLCRPYATRRCPQFHEVARTQGRRVRGLEASRVSGPNAVVGARCCSRPYR
nr:hypothetical protein [uncultured bacterium]